MPSKLTNHGRLDAAARRELAATVERMRDPQADLLAAIVRTHQEIRRVETCLANLQHTLGRQLDELARQRQ
jgi:hypothetical protein